MIQVELEIRNIADRATVAGILVENGYNVISEERKDQDWLYGLQVYRVLVVTAPEKSQVLVEDIVKKLSVEHE